LNTEENLPDLLFQDPYATKQTDYNKSLTSLSFHKDETLNKPLNYILKGTSTTSVEELREKEQNLHNQIDVNFSGQ
jgi:hypothetical protein